MKKWIIIDLVLLLILAAVAGGFWMHRTWYYENHVFIGEDVYEKSLTELDLRGQGRSIEYYEQVKAALPGCRIRYDVEFQGKRYDDDTAELTVTTLSESDFAVLEYLPQLSAVHAEGCTDYEALQALREAYPQLSVSYTVELLGEAYPHDTAELSFGKEQPTADELTRALQWLPEITAIHFDQPTIPADDLRALRDSNPDIAFTWKKDAFGQTFDDTVTEIDISGMTFGSLDEVKEQAIWFPNLEKLVMIDCGYDNETMAAFREEMRPYCKVVWKVKVGRLWLRTDDLYYMPIKYGETVSSSQLGNLTYCEDMLCVDLGHMHILDISWVKGMTSLKYLIVADCEIANIAPISSCKNLIYVELFDTNISDFTPLLGCTSLQDANLAQAYNADFRPLAEMTWLKNLWVNRNGISQADRKFLTESLPDTRIEFDAGWITGNGWRELQNYFDMRDLLGMAYNPW